MSTKIRGITIEIGGDTSGLDKALKDVNSTISATQKELKDVNKLLKLDPGNSELLAQKQRALGDAVKETSDKLEVLKSAAEKASEALSKGDISQSQYDAIQREIIFTTNKLNNLTEAQNNFSIQSEQIKAVGDKWTEVGNKISEAGKKMAAVSATATAAIAKFVSAASNQEEALNKVEVSFGTSADAVKEFAERATESAGLSKTAALDAAALFGDMATSMGLSQSAAADMSIELTQLAGDLASFKNLSTDQTMNALKGVFTGETESLKNLGIVMTETNLKAYALEKGMTASYDSMSQAEKVALRYQYVMEHTVNAQGDYINTADGTANSVRTLKEELENLCATLGEQLTPIITPIIQKITEVVKKIEELPAPIQKALAVLLLITAAVAPVLIVIGTLCSSIGNIISIIPSLVSGLNAVKTAILAMNSSLLTLLANPVTWEIAAVVAALAALGVAIYEVITHWDELKESASSVLESMQNAFSNAGGGLKGIVEAAFSGISTTVKGYMQQVYGVTEEQLNGIISAFTSAGKGILDSVISSFEHVKNEMVNHIKSAIDAVIKEIKQLPEKAKAALQGLVDKISEPFENLIQKATKWGADLVDNFAGGILGNDSADNAAKSMASSIKSYVGFSEPEKGPLSNFHTYAPDMIDLWAKGIKQNMYKVTSMTTKLATAMNPYSGTTTTSSSTASTSTGSTYTGSTMNVYVDHISELSDLVRIQNQAQQRARMGANA